MPRDTTDPTDEATEFLRRYHRCPLCRGRGKFVDHNQVERACCLGTGIDPAAKADFDRVLKAKTGPLVEALTMAAGALRWWATSRHGQKWFCDGREQDPNGTHETLAIVEVALSTYDKEKANG